MTLRGASWLKPLGVVEIRASRPRQWLELPSRCIFRPSRKTRSPNRARGEFALRGLFARAALNGSYWRSSGLETGSPSRLVRRLPFRRRHPLRPRHCLLPVPALVYRTRLPQIPPPAGTGLCRLYSRVPWIIRPSTMPPPARRAVRYLRVRVTATANFLQAPIAFLHDRTGGSEPRRVSAYTSPVRAAVRGLTMPFRTNGSTTRSFQV